MMMVVVDDAFDAPTIKYLIRCVEEGLLEVQTKSFALSSRLETEAPTTLEMVNSHLLETSKEMRLSLSTLALVLDALQPLDSF